MVFNSLGFIVFFAVILVLYYGPFLGWVNKKRMLLFSSYVFYGLWNPPLIILLWISTMVDWIAGNKLYVEEKQNKRKFWLLLSMGRQSRFSGLLQIRQFFIGKFYFSCQSGRVFIRTSAYEYHPSYGDFVLYLPNHVLHHRCISKEAGTRPNFFGFCLICHLFSATRSRTDSACRRPHRQFYEEKKAKADLFIWGLFLLTLGLFEKIVMADTMFSGAADAVFNADKNAEFLGCLGRCTCLFSADIF
jgi:alginate O-acetyltransferase complex protein AlgI